MAGERTASRTARVLASVEREGAPRNQRQRAVCSALQHTPMSVPSRNAGVCAVSASGRGRTQRTGCQRLFESNGLDSAGSGASARTARRHGGVGVGRGSPPREEVKQRRQRHAP
eukprot:3131894-Rhodomonas_salina.1